MGSKFRAWKAAQKDKSEYKRKPGQGIVMKIQKMFQDRTDKENTVEKSNKL